jgi:hypothetical protein
VKDRRLQLRQIGLATLVGCIFYIIPNELLQASRVLSSWHTLPARAFETLVSIIIAVVVVVLIFSLTTRVKGV